MPAAGSSNSIFALGPWIISSVALAQVWVIALWKRFVIKPKLELYESDPMEIGHSSFGPTVAIRGTLRARNKDSFIRNLRLKVTREKDSSLHQFGWFAHRPNTLGAGAPAAQLQLVGGFLLTTNTAWSYNTVFVDQEFLSDLRPRLADTNKRWLEFVGTELERQSDNRETVAEVLQNPTRSAQLYDAFAKTPQEIDVWVWLQREFYWSPGSYGLEITVDQVGGAPLQQSFRFTVDESESKNLLLNNVAILREACGLGSAYNFAYPEFSSLSNV
jgi:hypothetical protein